MLADFLSALLDLRRPETVMGDGLIYSTHKDGGLTIMPPPLPVPLEITTLSGFIEATKAGVDGCSASSAVIQVNDYRNVTLVSLLSDKYGNRKEFLRAEYQAPDCFPFGAYLDPECFIIELQAGFCVTDNLTKLITLVSSLSASNSVETSDDGISQSVVVKKSAIQRGKFTVAPRIALRAHRTFLEVEQPETEFLIRMKGEDGKLPSVALHQVDGGAWKHDAMINIAKLLQAQLPEYTVLA